MTTKKIIKGGSFLINDMTPEDMFTPEDFTDEHQMIARTTEDFIENEVVPVIDKLENQEFDESIRLLREAGELGLLSADIPEQYGGLNLDKVSSSLIVERFFRVGGFALTHSGHIGIGSLPIVYFGNESQKGRYLPKLATGEMIAAYALTEPGSGTDALGAKARAQLNEAGTHYILNGEKQWITNSHFADVFIVYAKIDDEHFTAFIVERDFPGVSVGPEEEKMGMNSSSTRTLVLENAEVPVENLLGEKGRGHVIAFNILNFGRIKLATGTVGGSKRALQLASTYVNEREQFKQPISSFTLTQEKLGTMAANIYANESAVYRTIGLFEQNMGRMSEKQLADGHEIANAIAEYQVECSMTKFMCTELLDYVVDEAVQLHGGYGFMKGYEVERMYRDSRINRIFEGTNEINRMLVPGTMIRRAISGENNLIEQANILKNSLSSYHIEDAKVGLLSKEKQLLKQAKEMVLYCINYAIEKHGEKLANEQEVVSDLANMIAEVYNMEAAYVRTVKAVEKSGESKNKQKINYTVVYVQEAFDRITRDGKEILVTGFDSEDKLQENLANLNTLSHHIPTDVVLKKREIAAKIIDAERYVV